MYPHQNFTRIPKLCSNRPESTCSKNYSRKTANSPAEYLPSTCEYPPKFMEFKRSLSKAQSLTRFRRLKLFGTRFRFLQIRPIASPENISALEFFGISLAPARTEICPGQIWDQSGPKE